MKIFDSYQQKELFLASLQIWRPRKKFKTKLLFCYKDYLYDHSLYSLILYFKMNYANIDFIGFSREECPRENPGLSSIKLLKKIGEFKPNVVFTNEKILSAAEIDHALGLGINLITSTCGYSSFDYGGMSQTEAIENLAKYALYLVPHAPHVPKLRSVGIHAVEFPFWFEPTWFHPLKKEKLFDVFFVGDFITPLNKNRLELLELLSKNYKVAVASDQNTLLPNVHHLGATTNPHKLNEWINLSRITIGSDLLAEKKSLNDTPGGHLFMYDDEFFIRQRTYLTMGAGACYLVERHGEIEKKFVDGEEIILWDHYQDLVDKVKYLLRNNVERDSIGSKAAVKSLAEHATSVRVNQLVQMI